MATKKPPDRVVNPVALDRITRSLPIMSAINDVVTAVHIIRTHAGQLLLTYLLHTYEHGGSMAIDKQAVLQAFRIIRRSPLPPRCPAAKCVYESR